jgi:sugar phosphate isomerase/epimerase
VEANDVEINRSMLQDSGINGPLWWRYRQIGKGQVDWGQLIEALKLYDYQGTFSIHLDDEFLDGDTMVLEHALDDGIRKIKPLLRG